MAAFLIMPSLVFSKEEKVKVAMVDFKNSSGVADVDFLSRSLPLTLANSLKKDKTYDIYTPKDFKKVVKNKKFKQTDLMKAIESNNIADLNKKIDANAIIYGDYLYNIEDDSLKVNVKLYLKSQQSEIVFAVDGYLGFAIFNIIDRVKIILSTYLKENKYITKSIEKNSKIGIITNLNNREINYLYINFLNAGYQVKAFMANDFHYMYRGELKPFDGLTSREMTSDSIPKGSKKMNQFIYSPFLGNSEEKYNIDIQNQKIIEQYTNGYKPIKLNAIRKIKENYQVDYLIFINIDHKKNKLNARAIDLSDENIIWIQNGINAQLKGKDSEKYAKVARVVIKEMSQIKNIQLDFETPKEKNDDVIDKEDKKN